MAFPKANRLLTAAMLASTALAASLGCSSDDDERNERGSPLNIDGGPGDPGDPGSDAGPGELSCRTEEGPNGESCAVCIDNDFRDVTVICDPLECSTLTMPDGTVCTTCLETDGHYETACDEPAGCTSTVDGFGRVCTTCPGRAEPECLPADCVQVDGCLECEDPKGHRATDCSPEYGVFAGTSAGFPVSAQFGGGSTTWGYPGGSFTGATYPGVNSCFPFEEEGVRCLVCRNGAGVCTPYVDDWVQPDPLADRPANLPAPGTCVSETSADGLTQCMTCTREDLTAQVWCHHPEQAYCQVAGGPVDELCWECDGPQPNPNPRKICHPPVP